MEKLLLIGDPATVEANLRYMKQNGFPKPSTLASSGPSNYKIEEALLNTGSENLFFDRVPYPDVARAASYLQGTSSNLISGRIKKIFWKNPTPHRTLPAIKGVEPVSGIDQVAPPKVSSLERKDAMEPEQNPVAA